MRAMCVSTWLGVEKRRYGLWQCAGTGNHSPGVAELGGPGGPGGPWPPQKFEWVGQGMFWPPQNFDHCPPPSPYGRPVVKLFAKLFLRTLKCAKFSKFFACGELIWVEIIPQVMSCFFRANILT